MWHYPYPPEAYPYHRLVDECFTHSSTHSPTHPPNTQPPPPKGVRVGALGNKNPLGQHCRCLDGGGATLGANIARRAHKPWDDAEFWCGDFSTLDVCTMDAATGKPVSSTRARAAAANATLLHCGKCSACSAPSDMQVLQDTRTYITTALTRCSVKFAEPSFLGGHRNLTLLRACIRKENITFRCGVVVPLCLCACVPVCLYVCVPV